MLASYINTLFAEECQVGTVQGSTCQDDTKVGESAAMSPRAIDEFPTQVHVQGGQVKESDHQNLTPNAAVNGDDTSTTTFRSAFQSRLSALSSSVEHVLPLQDSERIPNRANRHNMSVVPHSGTANSSRDVSDIVDQSRWRNETMLNNIDSQLYQPTRAMSHVVESMSTDEEEVMSQNTYNRVAPSLPQDIPVAERRGSSGMELLPPRRKASRIQAERTLQRRHELLTKSNFVPDRRIKNKTESPKESTDNNNSPTLGIRLASARKLPAGVSECLTKKKSATPVPKQLEGSFNLMETKQMQRLLELRRIRKTCNGRLGAVPSDNHFSFPKEQREVAEEAQALVSQFDVLAVDLKMKQRHMCWHIEQNYNAGIKTRPRERRKSTNF